MSKAIYKVLGASQNSGEFESTPYDYTKLNVLMSQATDDGNRVGYNAVALKFGKSGNFSGLAAIKYPCDMELDLETVVSGNGVSFKVISAALVK
jgi:hypothetical protein